MEELFELFVKLVKFTFMLVLLLLVPVALIVSTPFVLLWPRPEPDESYGRTVFRRYAGVFRKTFFITIVGSSGIED